MTRIMILLSIRVQPIALHSRFHQDTVSGTLNFCHWRLWYPRGSRPYRIRHSLACWKHPIPGLWKKGSEILAAVGSHCTILNGKRACYAQSVLRVLGWFGKRLWKEFPSYRNSERCLTAIKAEENQANGIFSSPSSAALIYKCRNLYAYYTG